MTPLIFTAFGKVCEVGVPEKVRVPIQFPNIRPYSGEEIQIDAWLPALDGIKVVKCWITDTEDGWHKHRCEMARFWKMPEPVHPHFQLMPTKEIWRVRVSIEGKESTIDIEQDLDPAKIQKDLELDIVMRLHDEFFKRSIDEDPA